MARNINGTAVVSDVEPVDKRQKNGPVFVSLTSVKHDSDGMPSFTMVTRWPGDSPALEVLQLNQVIGVELRVTGGVVLQKPPEVVEIEAPTPVIQAEVVLPRGENKDAGPPEWAGSAAITDDMLVNGRGIDPLKDQRYRDALGIAPTPTGPAPSHATAEPSARSQYAGDRV